MNYYIIPKNNNIVKIMLKLTNEKIIPYLSYSLIFYLNELYEQISKLDNESEEMSIEYVNNIVNPFQFIHTNVPGSIFSVSKVKPDAHIFFELMEVFQLCNINDILSLKHKINILHLSPNHSSTNYLLNMLREENNDSIVCEDFDYKRLKELFITNKFSHNLDLIICEFKAEDYSDTKKYINNMILTLIIVLNYQMNEGTFIIKIDNIFYKVIVDILYTLSSLYDKMYLFKPSISNITTGERYIICKSFNIERRMIIGELNELINYINIDNNMCIETLICNEIPYYFLNKIEESNIIIGQQQLDAFDQIINIFKNKNREEKIDSLKRLHIQKCIQWCEKNQLPHNKFVDKINIFLAPKKKDSEEELNF
jgi:hypothetical protein